MGLIPKGSVNRSEVRRLSVTVSPVVDTDHGFPGRCFCL